MDLSGSGVTIVRSGSTEQVNVATSTGTSAFSVSFKANETSVCGPGADSFALGKGFGNKTINNFNLSATNPDTIQFSTSAFSYLSAGMSQAQDLAAVLAHATSSGSQISIADSFGDRLTLNGLTAAAITAHPSSFAFK